MNTPERNALAMSFAQAIALQVIVQVIDDMEPGRRDMILTVLKSAAASLDSEELASELTHLIETL